MNTYIDRSGGDSNSHLAVLIDTKTKLIELGKILTVARLKDKRFQVFQREYRQPGLLCTPRNFAQSSKFLGKNIYIFGTN